MIRIARIASLLLALALILAPVSTAVAGDLGEAEKAGLVGERWDGYLGVVEGKGSKEIEKLVVEINAERRKQYEKVAARNKISVAEVAKIAGQKLIKGTKPGRYVMPSEGKWVKK